MYLADYHTHSRFSADGRASMLDMARAAAAAGLAILLCGRRKARSRAVGKG